MGPIDSKGSWVWFMAAFLACVIAMACAPKKTPAAVVTTPAPAPAPGPEATTAAAADQLPDGAGRQILMSACVACHGLREVTKFRGFYTRSQWRDIVLTMVDYGAAVGDKDAEVLTNYLTENLGKK
jgi:mono/diheme cytochrome c family protein